MVSKSIYELLAVTQSAIDVVIWIFFLSESFLTLTVMSQLDQKRENLESVVNWQIEASSGPTIEKQLKVKEEMKPDAGEI